MLVTTVPVTVTGMRAAVFLRTATVGVALSAVVNSAVALTFIPTASPVTASAGIPSMFGRDNAGVVPGARFGVVTADGTLTGLCTVGVPWRTADGQVGFVTAGHCFPLGAPQRDAFTFTDDGDQVQLSSFLGTVTFSTMPQTSAVGDVAFVATDRHPSTMMFVGERPDVRSVVPLYADVTLPQVDEVLCASGVTTGETCGWRVLDVDSSVTNEDGTVVGRQVMTVKEGQCSAPGDSGGVVYRRTPHGTAVAVGIVASVSGGDGDFWGGRLDPCRLSFTPLTVAAEHLGGHPLTSN